MRFGISPQLNPLQANMRSVLQVNRTSDPTRTLTLRNNFARDCARRFNALKKVIKQSIVDNDCFGLDSPQNPLAPINNLEAIPPKQFEFNNSEAKISLFMEWLRRQQDQGILEIVNRNQVGVGIQEAWTNTYILTAYEKGVNRADSELKGIGVSVPETGALPLAEAGSGFLAGSVLPVSETLTPNHVDRVGVLYTRTFTELKGITEAMDQSISRVLATGMLNGDKPTKIARDLIKEVDGIGIRRAKLMAHTEIVRAHHQAMMQEFKNYGILDVIVLAEFTTARDNRVCPLCAARDKKRYTIEEAMNLIPIHPGCRCLCIPVPVDAEY